MDLEMELARLRLENLELRRKLKAQGVELMRRHRRDLELAHHLPSIAARLASIAADANDPPAEPMPLEEIVDDVGA